MSNQETIQYFENENKRLREFIGKLAESELEYIYRELAIQALKEKQERDNPKLMTMVDLIALPHFNCDSVRCKVIENNIKLRTENLELKKQNDEYAAKCVSMFPEVVEALRMLLHDTVNCELHDVAEGIMCTAYGVLHKYNIKTPRFIK